MDIGSVACDAVVHRLAESRLVSQQLKDYYFIFGMDPAEAGPRLLEAYTAKGGDAPTFRRSWNWYAAAFRPLG